MGLSAPYENLKGFAMHRPPLVVFMVCLGLFAVVLMSLSYYVKVNELVNPDISEDWNNFLENFAKLEFCITGNSTDAVTTSGPSSHARPQPTSTPDKSAGVSTYPPTLHTDTHILEYEGPRNYSVHMLLTIQPTRDFLTIPHNVTHISTSLYGQQLGLKGDLADELINVTADIPHEWNNISTQPIQVYTCVFFQGPPSVFPLSRSPPMCENLNETGVEYHARVVAHKPTPMLPAYYCRARPVIKVQYNFDPSLTVWLSQHDRSVINLHLMHTSYFLFVMIITLFCYAIIRGMPNKPKYAQNDKSVILYA